jgi:hypothetical protein
VSYDFDRISGPSLLSRLYALHEEAPSRGRVTMPTTVLEEIISEVERLHKRVETLKQMV